MEKKTQEPSVPRAERLAVSVHEACQIIGIGRTRLYQLINDGELASVRLGSRRLVKIEALREFIGRLGK